MTMTAAVTQKPLVPGRLEQRSTRLAFFIAGFGVAAWAPLVPYAKARAGLDDIPHERGGGGHGTDSGKKEGASLTQTA